jgi:hypothetical protein
VAALGTSCDGVAGGLDALALALALVGGPGPLALALVGGPGPLELALAGGPGPLELALAGGLRALALADDSGSGRGLPTCGGRIAGGGGGAGLGAARGAPRAGDGTPRGPNTKTWPTEIRKSAPMLFHRAKSR